MIRIYSDLESLSRSAAEVFVRRAGAATRSRGRFSVVLAGGHTPQRTYEMLAQRPFGNRIAWNRVHVFWGDERCVEAEDPRSNARMARHALLDHVPIPPAHIHPILCHESPADAAHRYDTLLRSYFSDGAPRFDLVFLGLGEDGHTASLFPGSPPLKEKERWAAEVYSAEQSIYRVTLTHTHHQSGRCGRVPCLGRLQSPCLEGNAGRSSRPHASSRSDHPTEAIRWPIVLARGQSGGFHVEAVRWC